MCLPAQIQQHGRDMKMAITPSKQDPKSGVGPVSVALCDKEQEKHCHLLVGPVLPVHREAQFVFAGKQCTSQPLAPHSFYR